MPIGGLALWFVLALAGLVLILVASAVTVRYWLWPSLANLLNDPVRLEQSLDQTLGESGISITVENARTEWSSWLAPRLAIGEIRIRSEAYPNDLLVAESVSADFGLRSLLSVVYGMPIFSELKVSRLQVFADKDPQGSWRLASFPLGRTGQSAADDSPPGVMAPEAAPPDARPQDPRLLLRALSLQGPWTIHEADLSWIDASTSSAVTGRLLLNDLQLHLSDDGLSLQTAGMNAAEVSALAGRTISMPQLEGQLGTVRLDWRGAITQAPDLTTEQLLAQLRFDASFSRLGAAFGAEAQNTPRLQGLSGRLLLSPQQGSLSLSSRDLTLRIPGQLPTAEIRLDEFSGQFEFSAQDLITSLKAGTDKTAITATLLVDKLLVRQGELKLQSQGRYQYTGEGLGSLEASGSIGGLVPTELKGLLPLSMGPDTRAWLVRAIQNGRPVSGNFRISGPLAEFPFKQQGTGDFEVRLRLEDQVLAFSPEWPRITGAFVDLAFVRQGLRIESRQALIGSAPVTQVVAEIADLTATNPILTINGEISGSLATMVDAANRSPVRNWLDQALVASSASGQAQLDLSLAIDLNNAKASRVQGELSFKDNHVVLAPDIPEMSVVRGSLGFNENGLTRLAISGRALGGPFTATAALKTRGSSTSQLEVKGELSAASLESWLRDSAGLPLGAGVLVGKAPYSLMIDLDSAAGIEVAGQSSLRGLAIRLPVPARKRSDEDWGLQLSLAQKSGMTTEGQTQRQQTWRIATVSHQLSADIRRTGALSAAASTVSGRIGIGLPVPQAALSGSGREGIIVSLQTESLDLSSWIQAFESRLADFKKEGPGASRQAAAAIPAAGQRSTAPALSRIEIDAQQVALGEQRITGVKAQAANQSGVWRIDLQSAQVSGQLAWTPKQQAGPGEPPASSGTLVARLDRLWLPPGQASDPLAKSNLLEDPDGSMAAQPLTALSESRRWPTVDLVAEDFRRGSKQFGRLVLDASPAADQARWDIRSLTIENAHGRLTGKGQWSALQSMQGQSAQASRPGVSHTLLDLSLQVRDGGNLLARLGYPGVVRATPGSLTGQIRWAGAPTDFQLATMEGALALDMQAGQFLKADAGLAKLISVVNLQSLPKRITLDFRDIFSEGFIYERVRGSVQFANGQARTENLRIVGIQASVLLEGRANLLNETQDLRILVLPEFNAGLASLGYAIVNPAVGLGSFIAQYLLRDPLRQALAYEYQITGRWDDPQVQALPRRTVARETKEP
jgi:uncharacterized protein (TIGR02099 family)